MTQIKIKQIRSIIGRPKRQKDTMYALGLRKMSQERIHEATPQIMGMVNKVQHLVSVEEIK